MSAGAVPGRAGNLKSILLQTMSQECCQYEFSTQSDNSALLSDILPVFDERSLKREGYRVAQLKRRGILRSIFRVRGCVDTALAPSDALPGCLFTPFSSCFAKPSCFLDILLRVSKNSSFFYPLCQGSSDSHEKQSPSLGDTHHHILPSNLCNAQGTLLWPGCVVS